MRGGGRLPALVVTVGLLAGCSDPAGALRRQNAGTPKTSPRPSASARPRAQKSGAASDWWQAPSSTKAAAGLKVRTGRLRGGRIRMIILDVAGGKHRALIAAVRPRRMIVGHFTIAAIKVSKSPQTGAYGVAFRYKAR